MVRFPGAVTVLLLVLLPFGCAESPTEGDQSGPIELPDLSWLEANAIPFAAAEPGGDLSDLEFLRDLVGDARVVALGEATHGTREFFRMKHRILEFLVRELDFSVFAMEATWAESNHVNDFVRSGHGDPAVLLSNLHFWTWNTQEVLDMILWMRTHNQGATGPEVGFFGFDMQFSGQAMQDVVTFYSRVDSNLDWFPAQQYICWTIWEQALTYPTAPSSIKDQCREGVEAAYAHLAERQEQYESASSPGEYAQALQAARVVVQHERYHSLQDPFERVQARDTYMAENVAWLLERAGPDARIVLWAHNSHVRDRPPWMGRHLRERYGEGMVGVGFSFNEGGFNAVPFSDGAGTGPPTSFQVSPAPPGTYEHAFHHLGLPRFVLDLRPLRSDPPASAEWLMGPLPIRTVGAGYDPALGHRFFSPTVLPSDFDVLIHFEETEPSVLLPFVN